MIFYRHGSEDSLDVDVFYVFDKMPSFKEAQEFCSDKDENRNIIVVENGVVVDCFKGTIDEVNNGLYYTYKLHKQEHKNVIVRPIERDVLLKVIRVVRCLLSHCSKTQYREDVKKVLKSSSWEERIKVLKEIDFSNIDDFSKNCSREDVLKVFAFQLGQAFGLMHSSRKEYYTKSSIEHAYPKLGIYLYRYKNANIEHLVKLINIFIEVIDFFEIEEKNGVVYFKDFNKTINLKNEKYV